LIPLNEITGIILAGGKSTRMGKDKSLLDINGIPSIIRIYNILNNLFEKVVISSSNEDKYKFLGAKIIVDKYQDQGPLSGIISVMEMSATNYVFIVPCDMLVITEDIIERIIRLSKYKMINIVKCETHVIPLLGIYPVFLKDVLEKYLQIGNRKVFDFIHSQSEIINYINLNDSSKYLRNINTPKDYEEISPYVAKQIASTELNVELIK
jgi:molybdenum cofactor guanylyltransferase